MNKKEFLAKITNDNSKRLYGDDFREHFLKMLGIDTDVKINNVSLIELLCLYFGSVSGHKLYDVGVPFNYDPDNPDALFRAFWRESNSGYIENIKLKHQDNGVRSVYGLTEEGLNKITNFLLKHGIKKNYALRRTCFHEYSLGLAIFSLVEQGFSFSFDTEVVGGLSLPYGNEKKNIEGSIRTDGIITVDNQEFYLEQDMGTETIKKLASKIKFYRDPTKKIIFLFHRAENGNMPKPDDLITLRNLNNTYLDVEQLLLDIKNEKLKVKASFRGLVEDINALLSLRKIDAATTFAINGKEKLKKFNRSCLLYDFKETRAKNLFEYIMNSKEEKQMALAGMNVYVINSELLYTSIAFRSPNYSFGVFQRFFDKEELLVSDSGILAHGIHFGDYAKLTKGRVYIEYVEEDVAGLVRVMEGYNSISNSNDYLIIFFNTFEFGEYVASLLCQRKNPGRGIYLTGRDDENIYVAKHSKLYRIEKLED